MSVIRFGLKQKVKVWAEYDKDEKAYTGNIELDGPKPEVSPAYNWYTWKRCWLTLTEVASKTKRRKS